MSTVAARRSSWGWVGWALMMLSASVIAFYGFRLAWVEELRPRFLRESPVPLAVLLHFIGGGVGLALGPWQFLTERDQRPRPVHRWLGRVYVVAVVTGISASIMLSLYAQEGAVAQLGFGSLAFATLATTMLGWGHARGGDFTQHRRWMIRSYALILAAVSLRIQVPLAVMGDFDFSIAYPIIAWSCWVPNMLLAEWWLSRRALRG